MDGLRSEKLGMDLFTFKPNYMKHVLFVKSSTKRISYMAFFEVMAVLYSNAISRKIINQIIKD
ncbi:hypothetical protein RhiirA4_412512 [Rhizophagus irregularis]|uniref:Uncharacterized protein n=1 Tax=Rhizophagus irregularis TaxID=588596 RepID=A0A2I1HLF9_9GLOM|nr:hypothetical protein RhiirA4_412512 [Rhizophagus irregularis]